MDKRGLGHLEAVLSIVLFIIAVFVIIQFFFPSNSQNVSDEISKEIFNSIKDNSSVDYITYNIKVNNTNNQISSNILSVNVSESLVNKNITVISSIGSQTDSKVVNYESGIFCTRITSSDNVIIVKTSENLYNSAILSDSCPNVDETYYQVTSRSSRKIISEKNLMEINSKCISDYSNLKKQLNIAPGIDFAFNIELPDTTIISCDKKILKNVEVNSLNTRVEILRIDGKIEYANFNLRIW